MATWGTLVVEWAMPVLIFSQWKQRFTRTAAFIACWGLHGGIALLSTLGPFSYAMMGFGVLMIQGADFDLVRRLIARPRLKRTVRLDLDDPLQLLAARVLARVDLLGVLRFEPGAPKVLPAPLRLLGRWYLEKEPRDVPVPEGVLHRKVRLVVQVTLPAIILATVIGQMLVENRSVPEALRIHNPPPLLNDLVSYTQLRQGWYMFAPEAPFEDMLLVVDATLADGSNLGLLTDRPPDFDAPNNGPFYMSQHWCEVHQRLPGWPQHWRPFKDYLFRLPKLKGWPPEKQVVALEVWKIVARAPDPGGTVFTDIRRTKLFDHNI